MDGGATKCRAEVHDGEDNFICKIIGGSTNIYSSGLKQANDNIISLIDRCIKENQLDRTKCLSLCLGSAGLYDQMDKNIIERKIKNLLPNAAVNVCSDAEILLVGGLKKDQGISLICGTGSIAFAKMNELIYREGGFGWRLGDEGSAWWISHQAIIRTLKSKENRDLPTELDKKLLNFFDFKNLRDFIRFCNSDECQKDKEAAFAKRVFESYEEQDQLAIDIVTCAIDELIALIDGIVKRNSLFSTSDLVIAGGIFEKNKLIVDIFKDTMKIKHPSINVTLPKASALEGALMIAKSNISISCCESNQNLL